MSNIRAITEWALRGSNYDSPEIKRLWITGRTPDTGRSIRTNYLVRKVGPMTYETASGSHYRLEGPPDPGYATYCAENNIELDLADPVKFRKALADFRWRDVP